MINRIFNIIQCAILILALFVSDFFWGLLLVSNIIPAIACTSFLFGRLINGTLDRTVITDVVIKYAFLAITVIIYANSGSRVLLTLLLMLVCYDGLVLKVKYSFKDLEPSNYKKDSEKIRQMLSAIKRQTIPPEMNEKVKNQNKITFTIVLLLIYIAVSSFLGEMCSILSQVRIANLIIAETCFISVTLLMGIDVVKRVDKILSNYKISIKNKMPIYVSSIAGLLLIGIMPEVLLVHIHIQGTGFDFAMRIAGLAICAGLLYTLLLFLKMANRDIAKCMDDKKSRLPK